MQKILELHALKMLTFARSAIISLTLIHSISKKDINEDSDELEVEFPTVNSAGERALLKCG